MKKTLLLLLVISCCFAQAQHPCSVSKKSPAQRMIDINSKKKVLGSQLSHEWKYDMKFVHLDLEVQDYTKYIKGNVKMISRVIAPTLDTFMLVLAQSLTIDSIRIN